MSWVATAIAGSSIIGSVGGALLGRQKAPQQAAPPKIDVAQAAADAANANAQNFSKNAALSTKTNDFNQAEAIRLLDKAIPGFSAMQAKMMQGANQDMDASMSGGLNPAMTANLNRLAAEKGVSRGTSGNFNQFSAMRDFGVNMMDWQNANRARALSTMSSVFGQSARVSPMSPMSMFVSPSQTLEANRFNEEGRYNAQQGQFNAQSAASNYNAQLTGAAFSKVASTLGAYGASFAGGTSTAALPQSISKVGTPGTQTYQQSITPSWLPKG